MNRRSIMLIGIAIFLTVMVILRYTVWSGSGDADVIQPAIPPATNVSLREESGSFLPPLSAFSAILDRPLFRADRRPEPDVVVDIPAQTTVPASGGEPEFVITGTVTGPSGGVATLRTLTETRRAYVGDTVEGWRVDAITATGVVVSQNGDRFRLPIGDPG